MKNWCITYHTLIGCGMYSFFHTAFGLAFCLQKPAPTYRRLNGFAYLWGDAGRSSPQASRRAGPPRVPSRQTGMVAEKANEKVRLESRKGREARRTRISAPSTTRFWICYTYVKHQHHVQAACKQSRTIASEDQNHYKVYLEGKDQRNSFKLENILHM